MRNSASRQMGCCNLMSTDFNSLVSPVKTGIPRRMAKGGNVTEPPKGGALSHPHHTIIIMPIIPHPIVGALAHAALLHHLHMRHGMAPR
jgi:hypothetical protein